MEWLFVCLQISLSLAVRLGSQEQVTQMVQVILVGRGYYVEYLKAQYSHRSCFACICSTKSNNDKEACYADDSKTEGIAFGSKDEVLKVNAHLDSRGQLDVVFPVKTWRNVFMALSPAGWIIVMISSQRRALDRCSSSRTLILTRTRTSEHITPVLGCLQLLIYSFINHLMA